MSEQKYRSANPLSALADGLGGLIEKGQDIYTNVKEILEDICFSINNYDRGV